MKVKRVAALAITATMLAPADRTGNIIFEAHGQTAVARPGKQFVTPQVIWGLRARIYMVSRSLYDAIPTTDVRKGWFLDAEATSANLNAEQASYAKSYGMYPYTQAMQRSSILSPTGR